MSATTKEILESFRAFSEVKLIPAKNGPLSFKEYVAKTEVVDEETVIQPVLFPAFAKAMLGWDLNVNLSAESSGKEGKPDFTPADAVSHPFVFETKGTHKGAELLGDEAQVERYLRDGAPRIKKVVLTNMVAARVFTLDSQGRLSELYSVNFKELLPGQLHVVAKLPSASRLAQFVEEFSRQELTPDQKIARVREAPEWNPLVATTTSEWILERVDRIVALLSARVVERMKSGALDDSTIVSPNERQQILLELQMLAERLGESGVEEYELSEFLNARPDSLREKALLQFAGHTAFYTATRLMLIRVWEDFGLIDPLLYDGGFDRQMTRFENILTEVVEYSFSQAKKKYRPLFDVRNRYSWFEPDEETYKDVVYELANTYLGDIESDILGRVYERLLERIDRKLLGIYYTPRDIISLIWDLIDLEGVADEAEAIGRQPRILDIATGSGGFLVEAALRLRTRHAEQLKAGAAVDPQAWLNEVVDGLNGIEYQQFAAYLAELNMLVQLGQVMRRQPNAKIPPVGIICGDTLSFHEPDTLSRNAGETALAALTKSSKHHERTERLRSVSEYDYEMDVACGNPPYIGEKLAAPLLRSTRQHYPYWEQFVGQHMDYLYWFLILGVSKLRHGGRFGFITSEYWLRAEGAKPLRGFLAKNAQIDRIVLLRDFRPFPDAPGHHSLIVIGTKIGEASAGTGESETKTPRVSIYGGPNIRDSSHRRSVLAAIRQSRSAAQVQSFNAQRSPRAIGSASWTEVILTPKQLKTRAKLKKSKQINVLISKGVETTVNGLNAASRDLLPMAQAQQVNEKQGIQLLSPQEVEWLGKLNKDEQKVVRRVANTKDVFPYACVIPAEATSHIYLAKTDQPGMEIPAETVVKATPFPAGLPAIEEYLNKFRPVLEAKTMARKERRPWWTLHRPRFDVVGDSTAREDGWSHYCLTSRWGGGGQLVVGLAPTNVSPASGLHVLRPKNDEVSAAYLAGLYNSSIFQEVALSLPPGQLRQHDLESLGLPNIGESGVSEVSKRTIQLAELVTEMVETTSTLFPELPEVLREDVSLSTIPSSVWTPSRLNVSKWGQMRDVSWIRGVTGIRSPRTKLGAARISHDLFGLNVEMDAHNSDSLAAVIQLESTDEKQAEAMATLLAGVVRAGVTVGELPSILVPTSNEELVSYLTQDVEHLEEICQRYRELRAEIESVIAGA